MSEIERRQPPISDEALAPIYRNAIRVLSAGFKAGASLLAVGLVVALIRGEELRDQVDPFADVPGAILDGKAAGIVDLAILALMATPLATVIVVATGFFRVGDRRYGLLSLLVLGILCVSVVLSLIR